MNLSDNQILNCIIDRSYLQDNKNIDTKRQKSENVIYDNRYSNNIHRKSILNQDCLIHIFEFLPIRDRVRVERVCKEWNEAAKAAWNSFRALNFSPESWGTKDTIDNVIFKKLLRRCGRYLKYVNLDKCKVSVTLLKTVALHCTNIEDIIIHLPTKKCSDNILGLLFISLRNLRCIQIESKPRKNKHVNGICLQNLNAEFIEKIALHGSWYIDIPEICYILKDFKKLHTLILRDIPLQVIDGEHIISLLSVLKNLRNLDVSGDWVLLNERFFIQLRNVGKNLISLNVGGNQSRNLITNDSLYAIASLTQIEILSISYLNAQVSLEILYGMNNLKKLYLCWGEVFDNEALELISSLEKLEYIDLKKCNISKHFIKFLPKVTQARNSVLTIGLQGTLVRRSDLHNTSPILKFII